MEGLGFGVYSGFGVWGVRDVGFCFRVLFFWFGVVEFGVLGLRFGFRVLPGFRDYGCRVLEFRVSG